MKVALWAAPDYRQNAAFMLICIEAAFSYDDSGLTTTFTERNGSVTVFKKDAQQRIEEKVFVNGTEKLTFNDQNQVATFTDKNGNTFSYEYDQKGNLVRSTDPEGNSTIYA